MEAMELDEEVTINISQWCGVKFYESSTTENTSGEAMPWDCWKKALEK